MTDPPEWPISLWFLLALLAGGTVYLFVRALRHGRRWGLRAGVVVGSFVALLAPTAAAGTTQDLTCRDGGVLARPNGALIVVCLTTTAVIWLLAMFWVAGDRAPDSGRRLAVIPPALIVPVGLVELMGVQLPLEDYCDGLRGVLHLQAALALLLPVAALVLASVTNGAPAGGGSGVPAPVVAGALVVVLLGQVAAVADRFTRRRSGLVVLLNDGKAFTSQPPVFVGEDPYLSLSTADLDGDSRAEVIVRSGAGVSVLGDRGRVLEPGPSLTYPAPAATVRPGSWDLAVVDADSDGRPDILAWAWASDGLASPSYVVLHQNAGARTFTPSVVATVPGYLGAVAVADFDGDGDVDLVSNATTTRQSVVVNHGAGRFEVGSRPARLWASDAHAADIDGDGRLDLVLSIGFVSDVVEEPGFLFVRRNLGGLTFSDAQRLAIPRTLLAVADLNGDRRADYVVEESRRVNVLLSRDC